MANLDSLSGPITRIAIVYCNQMCTARPCILQELAGILTQLLASKTGQHLFPEGSKMTMWVAHNTHITFLTYFEDQRTCEILVPQISADGFDFLTNLVRSRCCRDNTAAGRVQMLDYLKSIFEFCKNMLLLVPARLIYHWTNAEST